MIHWCVKTLLLAKALASVEKAVKTNVYSTQLALKHCTGPD